MRETDIETEDQQLENPATSVAWAEPRAWQIAADAIISVAGTVYSDEGSTPLTSMTVQVAVNGTESHWLVDGLQQFNLDRAVDCFGNHIATDSDGGNRSINIAEYQLASHIFNLNHTTVNRSQIQFCVAWNVYLQLHGSGLMIGINFDPVVPLLDFQSKTGHRKWYRATWSHDPAFILATA